MKATFYVLIIIASLAACKSQKPVVIPPSSPEAGTIEMKPGTPETETSEVNPNAAGTEIVIRGSIRDTISISSIPARPETVKQTHGAAADMMHYCVIVGSFVNEQNALNLQKYLQNKGFGRTAIMKNDKGMYRVSATTFNDAEQAQIELARIRKTYPQFADAWLLEVKN